MAHTWSEISFVFRAQIAWGHGGGVAVGTAVLLSNKEAVCFWTAKLEAVGLYESDALWPASLLPLALFCCTGAHSSWTEPPHCPLLLGNSSLVHLC